MEPKNIVISLPVEAWNVVMNSLGYRPYAEVSLVVDEIRKQAQAQSQLEPESPVAKEEPAIK